MDEVEETAADESRGVVAEQRRRLAVGGEQRRRCGRSFDVALTIVFKDGPAHDAYQVDPIHLAFVERNQRSWVRVQVFDSEE